MALPLSLIHISTPVNIEHDIRTVINVCWTANKETMDRIAGYPLRYRPTNSEFVDMLAYYLIQTEPVSYTHLDFGTLVDGYTELPASQTITLTNEGNADAVLSDAVSSTGAAQGQYFDITWQAQTVKSLSLIHI